MEVKRKQKFVRLKFGKVKLWSKAPSFYRVHPTHLPSGFGHAVVQRPHSALPNLPQRRTEVYFKYQQLKNHIIFLHTLSYRNHTCISFTWICFKKTNPESMKCEWNAWNSHEMPCFPLPMFGPCFAGGKARCWCVSRRWRASDSLGDSGKGCKKRGPKRGPKFRGISPNNNEIQRNINESQMQQIGSWFGTPASAASLIEFSNSLAIQWIWANRNAKY